MSEVPCVGDDCWYVVVARERDELRERLATMNECVRVYLGMRDLETPARPGWLEEEVAATDALLGRSETTGERSGRYFQTAEEANEWLAFDAGDDEVERAAYEQSDHHGEWERWRQRDASTGDQS